MRFELPLIIYSLIFVKFVLNQNKYYFYEPKQALEFINKTTFNSETLQFIVDSLSKTFQDAYAFNEISKNPPKTKFSQNYFKKVDIQKRLKGINTKNTSVYKFYQDLKRVLADLEDLHIQFDLSRFVSLYTQIYLYQPLQFYIKVNNNKPKIFGKSYLSKDILNKFKNHEAVSKIIEENSNVPILSINGKDPFYFITNFANKYLRLKSPYATFVYKFLNLNNINLYILPLSLEDLTNFTVVYENSQKFNTDFIILSQNNLAPSNEQKSFFNTDLKHNFIKDNINAKIDSFEIANFIQEQKPTSEEKTRTEEKDFKWIYNYNNLFKCRVDDKNKVNVYLLKQFGDSDNIDKYFQTIEKCAKLFDSNSYPIILINSFNPGGQSSLAHILLELLSPKISLNMYGAYRKTNTFKNSSQLNEYFSTYFANSENCEALTYDHLIKKDNIIKYSNDISDTLTEPFILLKKDLKKKINDIKKTLKHPRNPTDILVLTDGFSYSSAAMFLKYLQYYGGAITAGYFINPNISNIPFDSSLSPSIIFDYIRLQLLSPEGYKPLYDNFKWNLKIPGIQTFYNPGNYSIPLEYDVTPVDEKINIYELFNDLNYETFINESLRIFEKYKLNCNPENKKLIFISNECDNSFGNNYTHGGYQCGEDGHWRKKCVASFCDIGYIFDHNKHQCIIDVCSERENKKIQTENQKNSQKNNQNETQKENQNETQTKNQNETQKGIGKKEIQKENIKKNKNIGNNKENDKIYNYISYSALVSSLTFLIIIIIIIICRNRKNDQIEIAQSDSLMEDSD